MDLCSDRQERRSVTADELIAAERAERYKIQLQRPDVFPAQTNWQYIIDNRMEMIAPELYRKFLVSWETPDDVRCDYHELAIRHFPEYLGIIDRRMAVATVYSDIQSSPSATIHLITDCRLFDAVQLLRIVKQGNVAFAADCLGAMQPEYDESDVRLLENLYSVISTVRPKGEIRDTRMIFGRETRYICPAGHSNPSDVEYCETCGLNIYGLNEDQNNAIEDFRSRISVLSRLLLNR